MLELNRKGFAVLSPDLKCIGFEHEDFETCKRNCLKGEVVVDATPKRCGLSVRFRYHNDNKWFRWSRFEKMILKIRLVFDWEYNHRYGKKVLYANSVSRTENLRSPEFLIKT